MQINFAAILYRRYEEIKARFSYDILYVVRTREFTEKRKLCCEDIIFSREQNV